MMNAKPFVKWVGGKGQLLGEIRSLYPVELGKNVKKFAEPFVGGGAVLFDVLNLYNISEVYISDVNRELILAYLTIRDNVNELIVLLSEMESNYNVPNADRELQYYASRERFNALKAQQSNSTELAALVIFLNHTCFNGLYRVNC